MLPALLWFAIIYITAITVIMLMNAVDFTPMQPAIHPSARSPLVSICIPARNEQENIERAVRSCLEQDFTRIELIVLDDESTDQTPQILHKLKNEYPEKLSVIDGTPKPDGWLGKSWACHQLSMKANGTILFFIDADVWLHPSAVEGAVSSLDRYNIDFLTIWPVQVMGTFWEQTVIPIIYYGLLGLLPARFVYRTPKWVPERWAHHFAAACGQCMVFRRSAYRSIGGHQAVKNEIVEDVALAKEIKRNGFSMRMFHGKGGAWCRMYRSASEMWHGFRKNFLGLFNHSVPAFILMAVINFIVYVLPVITAAGGLMMGNTPILVLSAIALGLVIVQRLVLNRAFRWSLWTSLVHPLGVLWFHVLGVRVLLDHFGGEDVQWKNRSTT